MATSTHGLPLFGGTKPDARTILRLNGIASLALGALILIFAGPLARLTEIGRPDILAIFGAVVFGYGFDQMGFALGRGLRRAHVLLFAVADVLWIAVGTAFLLAGPDALTFLERALISTVAVLFGWFAWAGIRAARAL